MYDRRGFPHRLGATKVHRINAARMIEHVRSDGPGCFFDQRFNVGTVNRLDLCIIKIIADGRGHRTMLKAVHVDMKRPTIAAIFNDDILAVIGAL